MTIQAKSFIITTQPCCACPWTSK